jgi:hypothetical protein
VAILLEMMEQATTYAIGSNLLHSARVRTPANDDPREHAYQKGDLKAAEKHSNNHASSSSTISMPCASARQRQAR